MLEDPIEMAAEVSAALAFVERYSIRHLSMFLPGLAVPMQYPYGELIRTHWFYANIYYQCSTQVDTVPIFTHGLCD